MKKTTYIAPAAKVYAVQAVQVMTGSIQVSGSRGHATFYTDGATGDAMTKEDNFWDED